MMWVLRGLLVALAVFAYQVRAFCTNDACVEANGGGLYRPLMVIVYVAGVLLVLSFVPLLWSRKEERDDAATPSA